MPLMFDSIVFNLNPFFSYSATFLYFGLNPLLICYAARYLNLTLPSGRTGALFLWEQMYTSDSPSSKILNPYISMHWQGKILHHWSSCRRPLIAIDAMSPFHQ